MVKGRSQGWLWLLQTDTIKSDASVTLSCGLREVLWVVFTEPDHSTAYHTDSDRCTVFCCQKVICDNLSKLQE